MRLLGVLVLMASSAFAQDGGATDVVPLSLEVTRAAVLSAVPLLTMEQVPSALPDSKLGGRLTQFIAEQQPGVDFNFRFSPGGFSGDAPLSLGYHARTASAALKRWVGLTDDARKHDLHLSSRRSGSGWRDEPGWPVPGVKGAYFSEYLVHFEVVDDAHTRVEVIGVSARERDGTEWSMSAPDGWFALPHRVPAWRDVTPSADDERDTLTMLLKALR